MLALYLSDLGGGWPFAIYPLYVYFFLKRDLFVNSHFSCQKCDVKCPLLFQSLLSEEWHSLFGQPDLRCVHSLQWGRCPLVYTLPESHRVRNWVLPIRQKSNLCTICFLFFFHQSPIPIFSMIFSSLPQKSILKSILPKNTLSHYWPHLCCEQRLSWAGQAGRSRTDISNSLWVFLTRRDSAPQGSLCLAPHWFGTSQGLNPSLPLSFKAGGLIFLKEHLKIRTFHVKIWIPILS